MNISNGPMNAGQIYQTIRKEDENNPLLFVLGSVLNI